MNAWACRMGLLVLACLASLPACADKLRIVTEHGPPGNMRVADRIIGVATDKVREAMTRAGVDYDIDMLPWKLAYSLALREPATCIYSTARTPDRDAAFKWAGPLYNIEWTFFALAERHIKLASIDAARGMRIGTYKGDVPEDYLRNKGFVVDAAANGTLNPSKLLAGRIDLWVTSREGGLVVAAENGWLKQIVPVLTFKQSELYLACNLAVPDATMASLNAAFKSMRADGSAEAIDRKYENWHRRFIPSDP